MSIFSRLIGYASINCHEAVEIGRVAMDSMVGKHFSDVSLKRSNCVLTLASFINSSIKVNGEVTPIDPLILFQRISFTKKSDEELKEYLKYELAPYPLSIFNELGMRKSQKSFMYKMFKPVINMELTNYICAVDGGYLLHRVIWPSNQTFGTICDSYISYHDSYVKQNYEEKSVIVFDG